jgi:pyruvate formate lyase activating enzyme
MEELMFEIEKERDIMTDSGGGVTLCGGEPLMHIDDALAVLQELGNRGFHRTVDTTLHLPSEQLRKVVNECELFLVDLKHMDSAIHKKYTGVPNELILDNIRLLASLHKPMWIRIPLIEGINTDEQNIAASVRFISSLPLGEIGGGFQVNLLPYHDVGKDKHQRFWSHYNPQNIKMATPSEVTINHISDMFTAQGIKTIIGG